MIEPASNPLPINRRTLLGALGVAPALLARRAWSQDKYPSRPIKVIVPFGPGGVADITVRVVTERLGEVVGQRFVIENVPGAGGTLAAQRVLQSPADGYTLALLSNGTAVSVGLFKTLPFDPIKDFTPISTLGTFDFVLATNQATGFRTLADFLAAARAKPGALNIGTVVVGSTQQLSAVLFNTVANIRTEVITFRTTPEAIVSLLRNDVQLVIDSYASLKSALAEKTLIALATSGAKQSPVLPDVPSAAAAGLAGFDATSWNALFARAETPKEAIDSLEKGLRDVLVQPEVRARLLELGIEATPSTPAELAERLKVDIRRWSEVIDRAGIAKQ
jgi:tripartite-type tricarboxylate transporter receptor subunit TctC